MPRPPRPLRIQDRTTLADWLFASYAVIALSLFISEAALYLKISAAIKPTTLFAAVSLPILLRVMLLDLTRHQSRFLLLLWRDNAIVAIAFVLLIALSFFSIAMPNANLEYGDGKEIYILIYRFGMYAVALVAMLLFFSISWRTVVLASFALLVASIIYEAYNPGSFSNAEGRAAGFIANANLSATAVMLMCALYVRYDRFRLFDALIVAISFLAVFLTLSRGGMLLLALFLANYIGRVLYRGAQREGLAQVLPALLAVAALFGLAIFVASLLAGNLEMFDSENAQRRLDVFTFQADGVVYESDDTRLSLVWRYLEYIDAYVIFGHGAGFSRSLVWGPHNTYLNIWVNNGLLGLLCYLTILFGAYRVFQLRDFPPGMTFLQIMIVAGFFNHSMIHLPVCMLLLGVAVGASWLQGAASGRLYVAVMGGSPRSAAGPVRGAAPLQAQHRFRSATRPG